MLAVYLSPIYIIANSYLLIRLHRWLGTCNPLFRKTGICVAISLAYVFLVASLLIAFFLPIGPARRIMKLISNYWLGILLYLILAVLMADAICFLLFLITKRRLKCRTAAAGGICAMVVLVLSAWGAYNARIIQVTPYEITVNKDGGRLENLNVVFAGDIFDNEYEALDDPEELIAVLQKIQSKHGVYACYGNHDVEEKILAGFTFGGNKKKESSIQMDEFLERAGIHLLQDEAVLIDDSFYLYGRPDAQRPGRGINMRKTAAELMGELDTEKPVIVIDHEPKELQELADAGVDIDLCGHTHDGQMFPANLITALMWENSYGYLKKSEKGPYAYDCDFGCRAFWTEYACRYDCGNQPHHSTFSI